VLLVFDEAQHLSIECLETLRELLDQPPHCGLLFAGTHELEEIFTRQALELEQSAHSVKPFSYSAKHFG
jgi:DNA transposition AAA+ family ATPase